MAGVRLLNAAFAHRQSQIHLGAQSKALQRLSTGLRINSAADDAAGLAISERMRAQIRGLGMARQNTTNALRQLETQDGYLTEITDITHRMKELAVMAASDTMTDEDRYLANIEYQSLKQEIDRLVSLAAGRGVDVVQVGPNSGDSLDFSGSLEHGTMLGSNGILGPTDILSRENATGAMDALDEWLKNVNRDRASLGANINRLERVLNGIDTTEENLMAAESTIRDADMAKEMMNFLKASVLLQASQAMMSHSMKEESNQIVRMLEQL